jgi:serine protease Do
MRYLALIGFLGLLLVSCASSPGLGTGSAAQLPSERFELVQSACFEVVQQKSPSDSLTYDKPLNWELQDFTIRNDKYIPLGTAFAINDRELVTAAHVLGLTPGSQIYKTRYIREKRRQGGTTVERVHEIENINAFSNDRDYVVFTVKDKRFNTWLKTDRSFDFNTKIFTAGDAYGEGIVIREGVLLGETPEPENGSWNYLKSSAPTNPGSSGGPLLNKNGEVIGILLMHKDDFCYSLPMKEITPGKAIIHLRETLGFSVFSKRKTTVFEAAWGLPMSYRELDDRYFSSFHDFYVDGMDSLLAEHRQDLFPEGTNSQEALFNSVDTVFPQMFLQDSTSGYWFSTDLNPEITDIGADGSIGSAEIYKDEGVWLLRLNKPRDVSVQELWENPKTAMDLVLKGVNITRKLTERDQGSRILSYGKPVQTTVFSDRFNRLWQINVYFLEYNDLFVMTCSTPTPQGLCMIYVARNSAVMDAWLYDMKKLADFVNISYCGSLEDWEAYLKNPAFLFGAIKNVSVSYKDGSFVDVEMDLVSTRVREGLVRISKQSSLFLGCSVFLRDGRPDYNIRKMTIDSGGGNYGNYLTFYRWTLPPSTSSQDTKDLWKKMILERGHPYDSKAYSKDGTTFIAMLHPSFVIDGKVAMKDFAYTVAAAKEGSAVEEELKAFLQGFAKEMRIKD